MTPGSNPLAKLIDAAREANGWSDPDVVRRAKAAGHQISKSHISGIRREGVTALKASLVLALADGLGVPVREVLRAALETLGLPAGDNSISPEQALRNDPSIPVGAKQMILMQIRAARDAATQTGTTSEEIQEPKQDQGSPQSRGARRSGAPIGVKPRLNAVSDPDATVSTTEAEDDLGLVAYQGDPDQRAAVRDLIEKGLREQGRHPDQTR